MMYNNTQHSHILGWEYVCGVRSLPPHGYVINQWTDTFIYKII